MTTDITELAQSLKAAAENAIGAHERLAAYPYGEIIDISQHEGEQIDIDITDLNEFNKEANPVNILALVEALEKAQQHENEWKSLCEAAAVDLDDWREIDDKSRDLLCKLADTVIAKAEQSAEWERKAISNFEDCAEMSSRLEELESQRLLAFAASNRWADKFREAEKRITELESRTVKLPAAVSVADWMVGIDVYEADLVLALLAAAGIKVEAELWH
ncbi:TPA: ead/Ea22-like family protein [Klebsiella michiganensis]